MKCSPFEHKYIYQGTVHKLADYPMPGSSARERIYFDRYYCEKCLDIQDRNQRKHGTDYSNPLPGTLPA